MLSASDRKEENKESGRPSALVYSGRASEQRKFGWGHFSFIGALFKSLSFLVLYIILENLENTEE